MGSHKSVMAALAKIDAKEGSAHLQMTWCGGHLHRLGALGMIALLSCMGLKGICKTFGAAGAKKKCLFTSFYLKSEQNLAGCESENLLLVSAK